MYTHTHTHTHIYIYIYTHTHIYIYLDDCFILGQKKTFKRYKSLWTSFS